MLVQDHAIGPATVHRTRSGPRPFLHKHNRGAARSTPLFGLGLSTPRPTPIRRPCGPRRRACATVWPGASVSSTTPGRHEDRRKVRLEQATCRRCSSSPATPTSTIGHHHARFPNENCPQGNCAELAFNPLPGLNDDGGGLVLLHNFMTLLAAPRRGAQNRDTSEVSPPSSASAAHNATWPHAHRRLPSQRSTRKTYHPIRISCSTNGRSRRWPWRWAAPPATSSAPLRSGACGSSPATCRRPRHTLEGAILAHDGGTPGKDRYAALVSPAKTKLMAFSDRFALRRAAPHPSPLPRGEGTELGAPRRVCAYLGKPVPLPFGERVR